jgi:hypothetical protein
MVADGGAVIRPACRDARLPDCSLLLIHGNFTNLGSVAAVVLDEIRLFEFHSLDQCLDPVLAELGHSQMRARPLKNGAPGRLKVGPTSVLWQAAFMLANMKADRHLPLRHDEGELAALDSVGIGHIRIPRRK